MGRVRRSTTGAAVALALLAAGAGATPYAAAGDQQAAGTVSTARHLAASAKPVIEVEKRSRDWGTRLASSVWFSPDGDRSQDKASVRFTLAKRSTVAVKVMRYGRSKHNQGSKVVFKERLGTLSRGEHTWKWSGVNRFGRTIRDGAYTAVFSADQVRPRGRKGRARAGVYADTRFNSAYEAEQTDHTVYPLTSLPADPQFRDTVGITLNNYADHPMKMLGRVRVTVRDPQGDRLWRRNVDYHDDSPYTFSMPFGFSGRHVKGDAVLAPGAHTLRYKVWDTAGNPGGTTTVTVNVSEKPLVEATGSVVAKPTGAWTASQLAVGARVSRRGGDDPPQVPCGTVVPSEVYAEPGAMSYRSSDACGGTWTRPSTAVAHGSLRLDVLSPEVAPRGLRTSWVSMRGRPTVTGEADTAQLSSPPRLAVVTSAAGAGETVTTTEPRDYPYEAPYFSAYPRAVDWTIATFGDDSYDVAAVTVHYTYLTPAP